MILEEILDCLIYGFWAITMLHRCFIPYDEFCLLEDAMHMIFFCDITGRGLNDGDGYFEAGMSSATTIEEKGCESRRSYAKGNLGLGTNGSSYGVVDVSLSTSSCAVKEKHLSPVVVGRVHGPVKCLLLLWIELGIIVLYPLPSLLDHKRAAL